MDKFVFALTILMITQTTKPSVLVLPPYDEIANEGVSPRVIDFLEEALSGDTTITLISPTVKQYMGVPWQNIFDKKYCTAIIDAFHPDIIVMSKVDQGKAAEGAGWHLSIRYYNVATGQQYDSKVKFKNISARQIRSELIRRKKELIAEIKR